jgi:hypothetical protein
MGVIEFLLDRGFLYVCCFGVGSAFWECVTYFVQRHLNFFVPVLHQSVSVHSYTGHNTFMGNSFHHVRVR